MLRQGSSPVMFQVSGVMCHMSRVTCHLSHVSLKKTLQSGLPRLVYFLGQHF